MRLAGAAIATRAPALLLIPLPLLFALTTPRRESVGWRTRVARSGALVLGAVLVTSLLLPAVWVDSIGVAKQLYGGGNTDSLSRTFVSSQEGFFFGTETLHPGVIFYPVELVGVELAKIYCHEEILAQR